MGDVACRGGFFSGLLGVGGFETQAVLLFQDGWDFNEFVTMGYDATAEAGTMSARTRRSSASVSSMAARSSF